MFLDNGHCQLSEQNDSDNEIRYTRNVLVYVLPINDDCCILRFHLSTSIRVQQSSNQVLVRLYEVFNQVQPELLHKHRERV